MGVGVVIMKLSSSGSSGGEQMSAGVSPPGGGQEVGGASGGAAPPGGAPAPPSPPAPPTYPATDHDSPHNLPAGGTNGPPPPPVVVSPPLVVSPHRPYMVSSGGVVSPNRPYMVSPHRPDMVVGGGGVGGGGTHPAPTGSSRPVDPSTTDVGGCSQPRLAADVGPLGEDGPLQEDPPSTPTARERDPFETPERTKWTRTPSTRASTSDRTTLSSPWTPWSSWSRGPAESGFYNNPPSHETLTTLWSSWRGPAESGFYNNPPLNDPPSTTMDGARPSFGLYDNPPALDCVEFPIAEVLRTSVPGVQGAPAPEFPSVPEFPVPGGVQTTAVLRTSNSSKLLAAGTDSTNPSPSFRTRPPRSLDSCDNTNSTCDNDWTPAYVPGQEDSVPGRWGEGWKNLRLGQRGEQVPGQGRKKHALSRDGSGVGVGAEEMVDHKSWTTPQQLDHNFVEGVHVAAARCSEEEPCEGSHEEPRPLHDDRGGDKEDNVSGEPLRQFGEPAPEFTRASVDKDHPTEEDPRSPRKIPEATKPPRSLFSFVEWTAHVPGQEDSAGTTSRDKTGPPCPAALPLSRGVSATTAALSSSPDTLGGSLSQPDSSWAGGGDPSAVPSPSSSTCTMLEPLATSMQHFMSQQIYDEDQQHERRGGLARWTRTNSTREVGDSSSSPPSPAAERRKGQFSSFDRHSTMSTCVPASTGRCDTTSDLSWLVVASPTSLPDVEGGLFDEPSYDYVERGTQTDPVDVGGDNTVAAKTGEKGLTRARTETELTVATTGSGRLGSAEDEDSSSCSAGEGAGEFILASQEYKTIIEEGEGQGSLSPLPPRLLLQRPAPDTLPGLPPLPPAFPAAFPAAAGPAAAGPAAPAAAGPALPGSHDRSEQQEAIRILRAQEYFEVFFQNKVEVAALEIYSPSSSGAGFSVDISPTMDLYALSQKRVTEEAGSIVKLVEAVFESIWDEECWAKEQRAIEEQRARDAGAKEHEEQRARDAGRRPSPSPSGVTIPIDEGVEAEERKAVAAGFSLGDRRRAWTRTAEDVVDPSSTLVLQKDRDAPAPALNKRTQSLPPPMINAGPLHSSSSRSSPGSLPQLPQPGGGAPAAPAAGGGERLGGRAPRAQSLDDRERPTSMSRSTPADEEDSFSLEDDDFLHGRLESVRTRSPQGSSGSSRSPTRSAPRRTTPPPLGRSTPPYGRGSNSPMEDVVDPSYAPTLLSLIQEDSRDAADSAPALNRRTQSLPPSRNRRRANAGGAAAVDETKTPQDGSVRSTRPSHLGEFWTPGGRAGAARAQSLDDIPRERPTLISSAISPEGDHLVHGFHDLMQHARTLQLNSGSSRSPTLSTTPSGARRGSGRNQPRQSMPSRGSVSSRSGRSSPALESLAPEETEEERNDGQDSHRPSLSLSTLSDGTMSATGCEQPEPNENLQELLLSPVDRHQQQRHGGRPALSSLLGGGSGSYLPFRETPIISPGDKDAVLVGPTPRYAYPGMGGPGMMLGRGDHHDGGTSSTGPPIVMVGGENHDRGREVLDSSSKLVPATVPRAGIQPPKSRPPSSSALLSALSEQEEPGRETSWSDAVSWAGTDDTRLTNDHTHSNNIVETGAGRVLY